MLMATLASCWRGFFLYFGDDRCGALRTSFFDDRRCAAVTAIIASYHVGVEQQLWQGPTSCSGALNSMSASDLLDSLLATPVVRCDEIAWSFANISMAGWNMLFSSGLACFALLALPQNQIKHSAVSAHLVPDA